MRLRFIAPAAPAALVAVAALALLAARPAAAVDVVFQVRMSQQIVLGAFDPGQDFVDVAGDFNGWGTNPLTPLADADGDTVYSVAVAGFSAGQTIQYKFRYNGTWDGTEEFPGVGNNRVYTVQPGANVIDVWYNDFEPGDGQVEVGPTHWWNDTVFYEIFVRSFQDSDGDGTGDLNGLTQRLDHLNDGDPDTDTDLGITGIWLMPINDAPSYHGYDSVDYRSINPDYGTMADFEAFLAAAHARGIKVIVDFVMNHCSDQHPWFQASRQNVPYYRDWFRWESYDPGETGPWGQQVWHWDGGYWFYGLFYDGMPDLNYDNPDLKAEMFDTATFWLDTVGVDGFRLDAVLYIDEDPGLLQTTPGTLQFWADYNAHVKSIKPDVMSVGEAWTASNTVLQYVENDRLDICFEFDQAYAVMGAANGADAGYLAGKAAQVYNLYPYLQYATFLTNHDQDRVMTVLGEDGGKARVAAGIYLTLPGVPFVYYGEEIGMVGSGDHLNIRTPMQWTGGSGAGFTAGTPWRAVNPDYPQKNVAAQDADTASLLNWYRRLIHVRNGASALRRGTYAPVGVDKSPVLAFVRDDGEQTLLCLANTSPDAQGGLDLGVGATVLTAGDYAATDLLDPSDVRTLTVDAGRAIGGLGLAAYEVRVYELIRVSAAEPGPGELPRTGLRLEQNQPNPFNPATTIRYDLPAAADVRLAVYDVKGREVAVLADGLQPAGERETVWRGVDHAGRAVGAGVYVVKLETPAGTRSTKMTLVR